MKTRLALGLLIIAATLEVTADGWLTLNRRANTLLTGTVFEVALSDERSTARAVHGHQRRTAPGLNPGHKRMLALLLADEVQFLLRADLCEQELAINVTACVRSYDDATRRCAVTPVRLRFKPGKRLCTL